MPVFTEEDASKLVDTYIVNKASMRECEFDYFSSIASDYYVSLITENKDHLLEELHRQANVASVKNTIRTPIEVTQTINPYYRKPVIGRQFSSLSGLHTRSIYDIYRNSDFRCKMNYLISDSNRFFITLDFDLEDNGSEMRHTCTIWLNYRLAGRIPEDKEYSYQQQHDKSAKIIY
jgi:hypothetical protein